MVYTVDISLQGVHSSIIYVIFHSMKKQSFCVHLQKIAQEAWKNSTDVSAPSARFSKYDRTEKPQRSRPNNFFFIICNFDQCCPEKKLYPLKLALLRSYREHLKKVKWATFKDKDEYIDKYQWPSISDPRVAISWYVNKSTFNTLKVKMFKQP